MTIPEPTWRRRVRLRWPRMLLVVGLGLYYAVIIANAWPASKSVMWCGFFLLFLAQDAFFRNNPSEDELRTGPDWVTLTFPGQWKPAPLVGDAFSIIASCTLAYTGYSIHPEASALALVALGVSAALTAVAMSFSFRMRGPRRRSVPLVEYDLACKMVDPNLSLAQNIKRLQNYTWGDRQKTRDIASAALGLAAVSLPSISPYPR